MKFATSLTDSLAIEPVRHLLENRRVSTPPLRIGSHSQQHLSLEQWQQTMFNELVVNLETFMLAEKLADDTKTFHFKWPASAFQSWKLRHRRFKKLLPSVKYKTGKGTVRVKTWANYPECNVVFPGLGQPVIFQETDLQKWDPA